MGKFFFTNTNVGDNKSDKCVKFSKRIRPWQRLGFQSKKQYLIAKKNGDLNELEMLISQKNK